VQKDNKKYLRITKKNFHCDSPITRVFHQKEKKHFFMCSLESPRSNDAVTALFQNNRQPNAKRMQVKLEIFPGPRPQQKIEKRKNPSGV
jgi:hypothetical protein